MGPISLLFDKEPLTSPDNVKTTHSSFYMEGVEMEVTGFSDFSTGIVKIRLTWRINGVPFNNESLRYLRFMDSNKVKRDIVEHARRLIRLSKAERGQ